MILPPRPSPLAAGVVLVSLIVVLGISPPEAHGASMAGAAFLGLLLALLGWRAAPRSSLRLFALAVLIAVPLALAAQAPGAALDPLAIAFVAVGAGLAGAGLASLPGIPRTGAIALAATAGAVSLHALYQKLWGLERLLAEVALDPTLPDHAALIARLEGGRAFAGFITPAALGAHLALAMPVTVALAFEAKSGRRVAWFALALLQVAAFVTTASVTAAGALIGATALAACLSVRSRRTALAVTLAVAALLGAVAIQRDGIAFRLSDPDGPWRLRAGNARAAWAMAADHPWLGVGPGGFAERYPTYRQAGDNETRHVHDLPLELSAELGFPLGLLLTLLFFGCFLAPLARRVHGPAWQRGLAVGLAAFALHNIADFTAFLPSLLWLAVLLRGTVTVPASQDPPLLEVPDRLARGVAWIGMAAAVAIAGLSGMASENRLDARYAIDDEGRQLSLARRAQALAPWQPDGALLHARTIERVHGAGVPELERVADRAVVLSPVRPATRELRARVRFAHGDLAGAHADMKEATRLYPGHAGYARQEQVLRARLEREWLPDKGGP